MREAVAITGLGIASALGVSRDAVTAALRAGARPFAPVRRFDASAYRANLAAEVPATDFDGRFGPAALRHTSRTDRLALWAAADALEQARLPAELTREAALYVGASTAGMAEMEAARQGGGRVGFGTYWRYPVWATTLALGRVLCLRGPRASYMTACSSAAHALGLAARRVRDGTLRVVVAGGAESLSRLTLAGFGALGVLDPRGARPFDVARRGITLGEGAAFFVLEPVWQAERRGARVLALVAGYGASADAHHMIHPRADGEGAVLAIRRALADAGVAADDIDYVNAHGTGTTQNDSMEAKALRRVFGERGLAVSSSKSMLGHTLGAAAAVEAAVTVLGMGDGFLPPNPGVTTPDPELAGLTLVGAAEARGPEAVLSTSFAFGGNNAALVLLSPAAGRRPPARAARAARARVVVSGAAVSSTRGTAHDAAALWGLLETDASGGALAGLDVGAVLGVGAIRRMDPLSAATAALCVLAKESAALSDARGLGVASGTAFGALDATLAFLDRLFEKGPALVNPMEFPNLVHNAGAGHATMVLGASGPSVTATEEEICGDEAVRVAVEEIAAGGLAAAVASGGDLASEALERAYAVIDRVVGTHSRHASVVAALVVEEEQACLRRGGSPWARVVAIAATGPDDGVRGAVERALAAGGLTSGAPVDLWLRGATEDLGAAVEEGAAGLVALQSARALAVRTRLGDAGGAGVAAIALGAAAVRLGRARSVLVTSVTREGSAQATLLGVPA